MPAWAAVGPSWRSETSFPYNARTMTEHHRTGHWLVAVLTLVLAAVGCWVAGCSDDDETTGPTVTTGSGGAGATTSSGGGGTGGPGGTQGLIDPHVSGAYRQWHVLHFAFDGPSASETDDSPNPFLDYRLVVELSAPSGASYEVPGFFAGDGDGGETGDQWMARFTPDEEGRWSFAVSFVAGTEVALSLEPGDGTAEAPDGTSGAFDIGPTDKVAPDFRGTGRLIYVGDHFLRTQAGTLWIKAGADSPENFLGYAGFDNTVDQPGGVDTTGLQDGVHHYQPHVADWQPGDPDWGDEAGRGIIGALNYLASEHVNSIYFLPCNLGGDGRETYPYVAPDDLEHLDLSKLEQWEMVFEHAEHLGIALHFVLSETESGNEDLHDGGSLGPQRKLFYRELVARFAHHQGLFWNIGEENDYATADQIAFAAYLRALDPYDHPTTVHTHANNPAGQYDPLVGDENFELTSIQLSPDNAGLYSEQWRSSSAAAGRPWVVMLDEIGPAGTGVTDANAADIRRRTLWPAYLSGSGGVEWYFGYHSLPLGGDMRCEDFRTREDMWRFTWIARQFIEPLPLPDMSPDDSLLSVGNGQVLYQPGVVYAVYLADGNDGSLDLSGESGAFQLRWYDVATGSYSDPSTIQGGSVVALGPPAFSGDVAAILEAQ